MFFSAYSVGRRVDNSAKMKTVFKAIQLLSIPVLFCRFPTWQK